MRKMVGPVIWLIVISFVLWGVQSVFISFQKEAQGVGTAFGKTVTFKTFQDAIRSVQLFSPRAQGEKWDMDELENAAWQHIVLSLEAERENIQVADPEVRSEIQKLFTESGRPFDPDYYSAWVRQNFKDSERAFEESVRDTLLIRQLISAHEPQDIQVSDEEIQKLAEEMKQGSAADETSKEIYRGVLINQKKQQAFLSWWEGVSKRANVQKFMNNENP